MTSCLCCLDLSQKGIHVKEASYLIAARDESPSNDLIVLYLAPSHIKNPPPYSVMGKEINKAFSNRPL